MNFLTTIVRQNFETPRSRFNRIKLGRCRIFFGLIWQDTSIYQGVSGRVEKEMMGLDLLTPHFDLGRPLKCLNLMAGSMNQ